MTSTTVRIIRVFGLIGLFLAVSVPIGLIQNSISAAIMGAMAGFVLTFVVGDPFFGAVASWCVRLPRSDLMQLDQHYRWIDSHVGRSGLAALGYIAGSAGAILALADWSPVPNELRKTLLIVCGATTIISIPIVMFAAVSKIVLQERVESLRRLTSAQNPNTDESSLRLGNRASRAARM